MPQFSQSFFEAGPYINGMRGAHLVFWLDARLDGRQRQTVLEEIALLQTFGAKITLIVGDQPFDVQAIDEADRKQFTQASWQTFEDLSVRLAGIWAIQPGKHTKRLTVLTGNVIRGRRVGVVRGIDHGLCGTTHTVDVKKLKDQLGDQEIFILTGATTGMTGTALWLPTVTLAKDVAVACQADKLIYVVSDELNDEQQWYVGQAFPQTITTEPLNQCLLTNIRIAVDNGVERVHVVSGQSGHLLEELLSRKGRGLLFSQDKRQHLRLAQDDDVALIASLLAHYEPQGILAARTRALIEANIDQFRLLSDGQDIVACGALIQDVSSQTALIEAIAVHPQFRQMGYGETLLAGLIAELSQLGLAQAIVLTTHTQDWFARHGFEVCDIQQVPAFVQQRFDASRQSVVMRRGLSPDRQP